MTLRETIEKRNRLLNEARQKMQSAGDNASTEIRAAVDAMLTDANTLKSDIERLEACAETEERSLPAARPPRGSVESENVDERSPEERNRASNIALRAFMKG